MIQISKTSIKAKASLKMCALEWHAQFAFEKLTPEWVEIAVLVATLIKICMGMAPIG
jgi:hypothetical protein